MTKPIHQVVDTERPLPVAGDWFVIHTKSRQEKLLAGDLAARGVDHYLPLMEHVRFYGHHKTRIWLPVFPGYLFLRGDLDHAYVADRTKRVVRIIKVQDQQQLEWELQNIHLALRCDAPLEPFVYLQVGVRVAVRSGPFKGLEGVIEKMGRGAQRLVLQVDMLGQAMSVEVDASLLDVID
ncbi:MAG: transcription termination/antitermination NusG family protein [Phycisphaeraceae bacterium]|nr:transcription termination/antitermination NusG family protein [Phycisphaeraceae bacterium]